MAMKQAERDTIDASEAAKEPMRQWLGKMEATDATMPRPVEDVISTMSNTQKAKLPQYTQDAYAAKVTLRGEKP